MVATTLPWFYYSNHAICSRTVAKQMEINPQKNIICVLHEDLHISRNTFSSHMSYSYRIDIVFLTPTAIHSHQNPFGTADKGE